MINTGYLPPCFLVNTLSMPLDSVNVLWNIASTGMPPALSFFVNISFSSSAIRMTGVFYTCCEHILSIICLKSLILVYTSTPQFIGYGLKTSVIFILKVCPCSVYSNALKWYSFKSDPERPMKIGSYANINESPSVWSNSPKNIESNSSAIVTIEQITS